MKVQTEYIEWCDFWVEDTGNREKPRLLLIGDSISRAYRPEVAALFEGRVLVDNMASSRGLDNPDYKRELAHLLEDERLSYDVIHFNNGLHGLHLDAAGYRKGLKEAMAYIRGISRARLIAALSTPVYEEGRGYDNEKNRIVLERNTIMRECAEEYGAQINDLYSLSYGKPEIRMPDGLHYNEAGSRLQARQIVEASLL